MLRSRHAAVLMSVVLHQAFGFLWYGLLFHSLWFPGLGPTAELVDPSDPIPYVVDAVGWILLSYGLLAVLEKLRVATWSGGAMVGAVVGLTIAAPPLVAHYAFIGVTPLSSALDAANVTVAIVLTGMVLAGVPHHSSLKPAGLKSPAA